MSNENNEWKDDVLRTADYIHNAIEFFMRERAQLYGTIIYLMILNKTTEIELPPPGTFNTYGRDYYIIYDLNANGIATVKLAERPEHNG